MSEFVIRQARASDQAARQALVDTATQELRQIYQPRSTTAARAEATGTLVALEGGKLLGTTEYVIKSDSLYIRGIAVHPQHRGRGVCRSLVEKTIALAREAGLKKVSLSAIEETGNESIFAKLGFRCQRRRKTERFISPEGGPVNQVDMEMLLE